MNVINMQKMELRKKFLALRKSLLDIERQNTSNQIVKKLASLQEIQNASVVLSYSHIGSEVDLNVFNCEMQNSGKKIIYSAETVEKTEKNVDVVIVPGVAFDLNGYRLGRGGGFYDKLLAQLKCTKIGVCFDFQMVEKLPVEQHDAKVDFVVTEKRLIYF